MGTKMTVKMIDAYGRTTSKRLELATDVVATALTDGVLVAEALADATGCGLLSATVLFDLTVTTSSADAGANLDGGASIQGLLTGTPAKYATVKLPAPLAAYINPDGTIDLTNMILLQYLNCFTEAVIKLDISDGETVDSWIKGTLDR